MSEAASRGEGETKEGSKVKLVKRHSVRAPAVASKFRVMARARGY
jgi:hypothetical protein